MPRNDARPWRTNLLLLFRTTSFRLTLLYVAIFVGSAGVLGALVYVAARAELNAQMDARIVGETDFLRQEFQRAGLEHLVASVESRGRGASAMDYMVQAAGGPVLTGEMQPGAGLTPGWRTLEALEDHDGDGRLDEVHALVTDLGGGLLLAVGDETWRISEVEKAIGKALLVSVGLAAGLGILGGLVLSRAFLSRVDAISRTAEAIIGGDLTQRITVRGTGDDLDRLAATLNRMLDRIGALMESLHQVSSDVAHDLRTPLTRLYQRLEAAREAAETAPEFKDAIDRAMVEADGLLATFGALLRIAQVEGASKRGGFRSLDLSGIVEAVADAFQPDAEQQGHWLDAAVEPGIAMQGDRELLTQAIANLVENALRHTPEGTRITIRFATAEPGFATLIVCDDGPGVAPADLARLTHRFYRAERSRSSPGNGLGLTLVQAVAELHEAAFVLSNAQPGLAASLRFPTTTV